MDNKIRIQHVVLSLQPGGLENGVVNIVNHLSPDRFQSHICCLKRSGEFGARLNAGIPVHEMGWRGGNSLSLPLRLARLFRKTRPDIVHTRNVEAFFYGFLGAKLAGVNCVIHSEHGRTFDDRPIRFHVQRWFSARTQAVCAVSRQLKRDLAFHTGIPENSIQVLHNGVDLARFNSGNRNRARQSLGLRDGDLVIGSVGRLVAVKNYALLLNAIAALGRRDIVVVLVGDGPERPALEQLSRALDIESMVRFLGHRDDVMTLLPAMDVFVLPSISEGHSNTLLEAMASGIASVVSDVGGNPDIVSHAKEGLVFGCGDQDALVACLGRLCGDAQLRRSMGAAARERVMHEFSIDAMIRRYEGLYVQALFDAMGVE
ncbi:MAG TPA: glycosyltransferase [Burkholderiaceae bacterium]|nr:glycosyltransferase [Burkholderiaceae bacterium]